MAPDHQTILTEAPAKAPTSARRDDRLSTRETVFLVSSLLTLASVIVFVGWSWFAHWL